MPVFGLPTCLERILNPTIGSEILKGWNLYQEKYGSICVKLRFTSSDNGCSDIQGIEEHKGGTKSAPTFQTSVFKRKSSKTCARDKQRIENWRARSTAKSCNQGAITRSKSKINKRSDDFLEKKIEESFSTIESDRNCSYVDNSLDLFSATHEPIVNPPENPSPNQLHSLDLPTVTCDTTPGESEHQGQIEQRTMNWWDSDDDHSSRPSSTTCLLYTSPSPRD